MGITLAEVVAVGEAGMASIMDIVSDVKAGIAVGGGVAAEGLAVAEKLMTDEKFKSDVAALVNAIKAL